MSRVDEPLHRSRVVGGGGGGLGLATRPGARRGRRRKAAVTLIDRSRTHVWKPLLHKVAAGTMDPGDHELDYFAQAHWHGFRYQQGEMIGLDRAGRRVLLAPVVDAERVVVVPARAVPYDTLV